MYVTLILTKVKNKMNLKIRENLRRASLNTSLLVLIKKVYSLSKVNLYFFFQSAVFHTFTSLGKKVKHWVSATVISLKHCIVWRVELLATGWILACEKLT